MLQSIIRGPYHLAPRFDAGIHIRAQRSVLEKGNERNLTQLEIELSSYRVVFRYFAEELSRYFFEGSTPRFSITKSLRTGIWPRLFISCDDVDVRNEFVAFLLNRTTEMGQFTFSYVNASEIKLMKHLKHDKKSPDFQVVVDTAFDWYCLSLSNACFGWRTGYSTTVSTFMRSASRVSILRPTESDFKSKVLVRKGKWEVPFDYIDNPKSS